MKKLLLCLAVVALALPLSTPRSYALDTCDDACCVFGGGPDQACASRGQAITCGIWFGQGHACS